MSVCQLAHHVTHLSLICPYPYTQQTHNAHDDIHKFIHKIERSVIYCLLYNFASCSNALIISNSCYCKKRKQEIDRNVDPYYDTIY